MAVTFQKKCCKCRKNYVTVTARQNYVVCYECQKKAMSGEIKDPEMKKMFDIPEEFYKQNTFLCDIKVKYLQYGSLTERQIEAFKRVAKELKAKSK